MKGMFDDYIDKNWSAMDEKIVELYREIKELHKDDEDNMIDVVDKDSLIELVGKTTERYKHYKEIEK